LSSSQDQSRPTCSRCEKGSFTCLGYRGIIFIDGKEQVLRRLGRGAASQLETCSSKPESGASRHSICKQMSESDVMPRDNIRPYRALDVLRSPFNSSMSNDYSMSYLVTNLHGPMGVICRSLIMPSYQAESSPHSAMRQCFVALATTFYGLGNAQKPVMDDGRRQYRLALSMVNASLSKSTSAETNTLCSIFALCLHEVC
jgi:hypothetical protein